MMIKKNTEVIFEGEEYLNTSELKGGMPLSKGETVFLHKESGETAELVVSDKEVHIFLEGDDQIVNIKYILKKQ